MMLKKLLKNFLQGLERRREAIKRALFLVKYDGENM